MAKTIVGGGGGNSAALSAASSTWFFGLGTQAHQITTTTGNEARRQHAMIHAGTFSNFAIYLQTNGRSTASAFGFRKNAADGNQAVSVAGGLTGFFQDTTNTDAVVAGDLIAFYQTTGAGTGTLALSGSQSVQFEATSGSPVSILSAQSADDTEASSSTASATYLIPPVGVLDAVTSTSVQFYLNFPVGCTLAGLMASIVTNTRTTTSTIQSFINQTTAGNQSLSIGAGLTGQFQDTTHTDSLTAGVDIGLRGVNGTGAGALTFARVAMEADWASGLGAWVVMDPAIPNPGTGATYIRPMGNAAASPTQSARQGRAPYDCTINHLSAFFADTFGDRTLTLQVNGVDTALALSVMATDQGKKTDAHSVSIAAGDLVGLKYTNNSGLGRVPAWIVMRLVESSSGFVPRIMVF